MRLDDRVTIATPEGVTIDLVLAGLGSRFVARLLDTVIQLTIIFALAISLLPAQQGGRGGAGGSAPARIPRRLSGRRSVRGNLCGIVRSYLKVY